VLVRLLAVRMTRRLTIYSRLYRISAEMVAGTLWYAACSFEGRWVRCRWRPFSFGSPVVAVAGSQREGSASNPAASPIHAFGLFWRCEEIDWFPGAGKSGAFRLLGRRGKNTGTLRLTDFRDQHGIYILYGNYGPHYVGLTRTQGLGARLKQHMSNENANRWDRFSWFGFKQVLTQKDDDGLRALKDKMPGHKSISPHNTIKEMEALLIKAMALNNRADSKFISALEWKQVRWEERESLLERVSK